MERGEVYAASVPWAVSYVRGRRALRRGMRAYSSGGGPRPGAPQRAYLKSLRKHDGVGARVT
ncbi:hypothetical protein Pflav_035480 [Phytohabitans flavus]|uniref:Uncharacterized protein n=1 Tax=Phytohabitans flavus TaxID=1076124 RepID=A0A6F8XTS1_9ACTN|nr:hypothetical protein Pflav_035480 [Phytohabitans flavus]